MRFFRIYVKRIGIKLLIFQSYFEGKACQLTAHAFRNVGQIAVGFHNAGNVNVSPAFAFDKFLITRSSWLQQEEKCINSQSSNFQKSRRSTRSGARIAFQDVVQIGTIRLHLCVVCFEERQSPDSITNVNAGLKLYNYKKTGKMCI